MSRSTLYGLLALLGAGLVAVGCNTGQRVAPVVTTEPTLHDTDDPAVWINFEDPARSLILGTDKDEEGALYVFNLDGEVVEELTVRGLKRPNNVDVQQGVPLGGELWDLAVVTERLENRLRVYRLPEMKEVDGGGIPVFASDSMRAPMGIALYLRPTNGALFAMVSRKEGNPEAYLEQLRLTLDESGVVRGEVVRHFGRWSGKGEIESIAVDDALGFVYYSDENTGIRKYHADPDLPGADEELALFGTTGFSEDREGISIYASSDSTGWILVSDQHAGRFRIFPREGLATDPNAHPEVACVRVSTQESDGSETVSLPLGDHFPEGLFVAMSDDRTFQLYDWREIHAAAGLAESGMEE